MDTNSFEQELSNRIQTFFAGMDVTTNGHVFKQNGDVINPAHPIGLDATTASAAPCHQSLVPILALGS